MKWQRPDNIPRGQVWRRFKGRERDGKPAQWYQIRDVQDEYKELCLGVMREQFLRDEPLCRVFGITSDPPSLATIKSNWAGYFSQHISLACFTEENGHPDQMVGFNILMVRTRDDEEECWEHVQGPPWRKLLRTLITAEERVDLFKHFGVDKFMTCSGLTVNHEHRGQNIGLHLLAAREPFCKALGVTATASVFTALASQRVAEKCGFKVISELPYKEMLKYDIDLKGADVPCARVMGIKYNFDSD